METSCVHSGLTPRNDPIQKCADDFVLSVGCEGGPAVQRFKIAAVSKFMCSSVSALRLTNFLPVLYVCKMAQILKGYHRSQRFMELLTDKVFLQKDPFQVGFEILHHLSCCM